MTTDEVREVVRHYRQEFWPGQPAHRMDDVEELLTEDNAEVFNEHLVHCLDSMLAMCDEIDALEVAPYKVDDGPALRREIQKKREKLMRWLGFVQGTLWLGGMRSLGQLMRDNKYGPQAFAIQLIVEEPTSEGGNQ